MKALLLCLALALSGCASLRQSAHTATATDAASTAYAVSSGLGVEANPLMQNPAVAAVMFLARIGITEYVNAMPEPDRTVNLSAINGLWWGVSISNIVVLLAHSTPLGLIIGAGSGWTIWKNTEERREFAGLCAMARQSNPGMVCEFDGNIL